MKNILTLTLLLLLFSFVRGEEINKEQIKKFENILGTAETKYLNELVVDFDAYLAKQYEGKEYVSSLAAYLQDIYDAEQPEIWKIDQNKLQVLQKTNLFPQLWLRGI